MPKVSVIILTYQSAEFVREAIDSVLCQTYGDHEIIVVDGGSTDGTVEILGSYGSQIQVISQSGKGLSNARNAGIFSSKGEYIAFLDSDDLWIPGKLKIQVQFLDGCPSSVGLIYSDALFFTKKNNSEVSHERAFQMGDHYRGKVIKELLTNNFIPMSTVLTRKLCFDRVGHFDESILTCEDMDMWIRIAELFEIDYQSIVLSKIRLHEGSMSTDLQKLFLSQIAVRTKAVRRLPYLLEELNSRSYRKYYYRPYLRLGILYLERMQSNKAKQFLRQYLKFCPDSIGTYVLLLVSLFSLGLVSNSNLRKYFPLTLAKRVYSNLTS